ncbi:MAG: amino acid adenylation domain-containing protein [Pelatocladus maniniholoensis HA4357-MV3]|jgi:amino acid adenylation domain-containing protein|uniref:Amino acid adenylation domain-containing protein n=1 Tax=Pelatocladus maniniholoensis HA4357-MV3 TaxID=1117104 RepID=A0A9E3HE37_9NOST|nr:amino acid adenylation domain-containing protein [Pelatocladus maniniholoensis HA4357-MV3]
MQADIIEGFKLSHQQKRLWLQQQNSVAYRAQLAILIAGNLNIQRIQKALHHVGERHEIFRTTLQAVDEIKTPVQVIQKYQNILWRYIDVSGCSKEKQQNKINDFWAEESRYICDLKETYILRPTLITLSQQEYILAIALHSLYADGWTLNNLVREISSLYKIQDRESLAEPIQYIQFSELQNELVESADVQREIKVWRSKDISSLLNFKLVIENQFLEQREFAPKVLSCTVHHDLEMKIKVILQEHNISGAVFFLACWQILLWRLTGQSDLIVGITCNNRVYEELQDMMGLFAKCLPVHCCLEENDKFSEVIKKVSESICQVEEWQEYFCWEQLVNEAHNKEKLSFFPYCFEFEERQTTYLADEISFTVDKKYVCFDQFKVKLSCEDIEGGLTTEFHYDSSLFSGAAIENLAEQFYTLLESAVINSDVLINELQILSATERQKLLVEWNDTTADYNQKQCLHQLFESVVEQTPDAVAVVFEDEQLTYSELNARANQLAHYLRSLGVKPEVLVGICVERSLLMVIGILAILKAGGAYVPIDPSYPLERKALILNDSQMPVLLTQQHLLADLATNEIQVISVDSDWQTINQQKNENPITTTTTLNLAYVIYTSGSTGKPKGVPVTHKNLVHSTSARIAYYSEPVRSFLLIPSFAFDSSVAVIFWTLCQGGTLVLINEGRQRDIWHLGKAIAQHQISHWLSVPSLYALLLNHIQPAELISLRTVIVAGETCSPALVKHHRQLLPQTSLFNEYGPTEASVWSSVCNCQDYESSHTIPIGRLISNTQIYLLDTHLQPLPIGVSGELHIGGVGLARGYLNQPELTALKFIPNPFSKKEGDRLYKTGDLARYLPSGDIEYIGRIDNQTKIRGYRIELGEIESAINQHTAVRENVVVVSEESVNSQRIVAYVVPQEEQTLTIPELRSFLESKLPNYMMPAAFVTSEALPLTPNGKVDRKALSAPDKVRPELEVVSQPPQTEVEQAIANIWQEVLNVKNVGIHDNFFEMGGHSLLLIQVYSKLQKLFQRDFLLVEMFQYPTISHLAKFFSQESREETSIKHSENRTASVSRRRQASLIDKNEIAIIGMAGRFPGSKNVDNFWQKLQNGVESISFFTDEELISAGVDQSLLNDSNYVKANGILEDIELFDASFFGFSPREAEITDPQHRLFMECVWDALENAGYNSETYSGQIGLFAGVAASSYLLSNLYSNQNLMELRNNIIIGNDKDFLPTQISYKLNLRGPSINVQTACSTSLVAIHLACQSLLNGESDMALAGGVTVGVPQKTGYYYQQGGIKSPDGHCRAFDAQAKGTIGGSGLGAVVLKRLEDAIADGDYIHGVIKGSAVNNDGSLKVGYTAPSVDGQRQVILEALTLAGVEPETVTYVETHGTGTILGDPIEIKALTQAFRSSTNKKGFCAIGSVKTNVGHLDTAAGVTGLIKTVLALKHKQIPPSLHFQQPNPQIDFANSPFYVNTTLSEWKSNGTPRRAGVSSFGIGGTNAHVILEEAPPTPASSLSRPWQLLLLCAKTDSALETATTNLVTYLKQHPDSNLADVAYTLQVGRREFEHRRMLLCQNFDDAVAILENLDPQRIFTNFQKPCNRQIVFMFPGQGSQYVNMGRELYETEPVFQKHVDECCEILQPHLGVDLRTILYPDEEKIEVATQQLQQTQITQPALFVIEYALAQLWMAWGISPVAMIGHSIGEYVAATLADVFSLEDALAVVATRGQLMQQMPSGAMLSVALSFEAIQSCLDENLSVAAINAPSACVVSGLESAIDQLQQELQSAGVSCRRLHTSHAFHSQMMSPIIETFTRSLQLVKLNPPKIPFVSNLSGTWITPEQAKDPNYWAKHSKQPVRFSQGVSELLLQPQRVLLEVGPGRTLSSLAKQHQAEELIALTSIRHPQEQQSDVAFLLNSLGKLWLVGVEIDWSGFYTNEKRHRIPLPTYPFERQRYWIEPQASLVHVTKDARQTNKLLNSLLWKSLVKAGQTQAVVGAKEFDEQLYLANKQYLEDLCTAYMNLALKDLGAFGNPNKRYSIEELFEQCQIIPRYRQLLCRWLNILVEQGQLQQDRELFTNFVPFSTDINIFLEEVKVRADTPEVVDVVKQCGETLANILTGKQQPLELYVALNQERPTQTLQDVVFHSPPVKRD